MDLAHIHFRLSKPHLRLVGVVLIGNSLPLAPSDQIRTETASLLVCDDDRGTCPGQTRSSSSPTPSLASTRCARTAPLSPLRVLRVELIALVRLLLAVLIFCLLFAMQKSCLLLELFFFHGFWGPCLWLFTAMLARVSSNCCHSSEHCSPPG